MIDEVSKESVFDSMQTWIISLTVSVLIFQRCLCIECLVGNQNNHVLYFFKLLSLDCLGFFLRWGGETGREVICKRECGVHVCQIYQVRNIEIIKFMHFIIVLTTEPKISQSYYLLTCLDYYSILFVPLSYYDVCRNLWSCLRPKLECFCAEDIQITGGKQMRELQFSHHKWPPA